MFFSRLSLVLAWALFILGGYQIAMVFYIDANLPVEQADLALKRYLGNRTPGDLIDRGALMLAAAILFGTLAEIGRALRK